MKYEKISRIAAPAERVFAFHQRPDALALLQPPWQHVEVLQLPASLEVGAIAVLRVRLFPLIWMTIEAEHIAYEPPRYFVDRMTRGPFAFWEHRHEIESISASESRLIDSIEYQLPLGFLGRLFGGTMAGWQIERLFSFRHRVTREICEEG